MHLVFATMITMIAFASNSILTRMAIDGDYIDPSSFAIVRVVSGALVLGVIVVMRGGKFSFFNRDRLVGSVSLAVYLVGFTLAYLTLDAGLGALILFGVVQITVFSYGALRSTPPTLHQMIGGTLAFVGLLIALWPGPGGSADPLGAGLMVLAGLGWGAYTIVGRKAEDPLAVTAANFLLCTPMLVIVLVNSIESYTATGLIIGLVCGGLTSGLGYALWYSVLPKLDGSTAAIVQLSVPIIAILAGAIVLGEAVGLSVVLATVLVIGGIGWSIISQSVLKGRS